MPDGQARFRILILTAPGSVEVLRGLLSAIRRSSTGGVINVTTETGRQPPAARRVAATTAVMEKLARYGPKATGAMGDGFGGVDYTVSTTRFTTHGCGRARKIWLMPNWACALTCQ